MKPTYQQLESELAQSELARTEQREELGDIYERLASKEYEVLMLASTISALQDDMIKAFNNSKLEVMVLQKKLDDRVLQ